MTTTITNSADSTAGSPYHTRAYRFSGNGGTFQSAYISGPPNSAFDWVRDPVAGAVWALSGASGAIPSWQTPNAWHANIVFRGAVRGYFVDEAKLKTALLAIKRAPDALVEPIDPETGKIPFRPLFNGTNVDDLVRLVVDYTRLDGSQVSGKLAAFVGKVNELKTLLDGGFAQSSIATMAEFYAKAATVAKIDAVFTTAARLLHSRAVALYNANLTTPISPGDTGA